MASLDDHKANDEISLNHVEIPIHANAIGSVEPKQNQIDYSQRAQWVRAAILGANDGLVSVASLMMGVGAVKENITAMLLAGFSGLIARACSMAIGEFVSVYTQYDIEIAQIKKDSNKENNNNNNNNNNNIGEVAEAQLQREKKLLPNPFQAALASALAFSVGAVIPLLAAAFIRNNQIKLVVVAVVASFTLLLFGAVGAVLGKTPVTKSCFRVLIGGWMAMTLTFGLTKLFSFARL